MPDEIIGQTRLFNRAAPGANTNIATTALTPAYPVSAFRITVALATASVFNVTETVGATTNTYGLNASAALNAGDVYTFVMGVNNSATYNFQVETDGIIRKLQVDEIPKGVI